MAEIYAISDDMLMPENLALQYAREILECGVKFFQFRSKKEPKNEKIASEIFNLCEKFGARFIVNDDIFFAARIGAKSVHLGKDDASIKEAYEILGNDSYVGVSCYDNLDIAIKAKQNGASYVAFGAMFKSPTKPNAPLCSHKTVLQAKKLGACVCVIGGINASNISNVARLKPDMIAIISAIYKDGMIKRNLENLQRNLSL